MLCWYQPTPGGAWTRGVVLGYFAGTTAAEAVVAAADKSNSPCGPPLSVPLNQITFDGRAPETAPATSHA
jgi:hypothetical protein